MNAEHIYNNNEFVEIDELVTKVAYDDAVRRAYDSGVMAAASRAAPLLYKNAPMIEEHLTGNEHNGVVVRTVEFMGMALAITPPTTSYNYWKVVVV